MWTRRRDCSMLLLALVLGGGTAGAASGDLDATFGNGGRAAVAFDGKTLGADLLVLPDGRVVFGGTVVGSGDPPAFALVRLDARGALDPEFGTGGVTITPVPAEDGRLVRVAAVADGKLLAGGSAVFGPDDGTVIARYGPDGSLDGTFFTGGLNTGLDGTFVDLIAADVAIVTLGEKAGFRVLSLIVGPTTLSQSRSRAVDRRHRAMAAQADGRLLVVDVGLQMIVTRLVGIDNDPSFSADGEVVVPPDVALDDVTSVVPLPDGRLAITGLSGRGFDAQAAVLRLLSDGTPDPDFGDGGRVLLPDVPGFERAEDAVALADGGLIVGGFACGNSDCSGFIVRLRADGRLDPSFGRGGLVEHSAPVKSLALADEEHLLVLGSEEGQLVVARHLVSTCGDGAVEAGEACDDGNTESGDCCDADCALEPDGSACAPDASACTVDACRAGSCEHELPGEAGCVIAERSALVLVDGAGEARDRVRFGWSGITVPAGVLGDPTTTTDVSLCVIDGPPEARRLVAELTAPGGRTCGTAPCWRRTANGFRYRDRRRANDGIGNLVLSVDGTDAEILLKAKGPGLGLEQPAVEGRLVVRVVQSDAPGCFESTVVGDETGATRFRAATR